MKKHIIAYAKRPLPGYAKTRLGEQIGMQASAGIYARLLYTCLHELARLDRQDIRLELCLASPGDIDFFQLAFPEFQVTAQVTGTLGERLSHSLNAAFSSGADAVLLLATDVPDLDRNAIQAAFDALSAYDAVIGPCPDGGYYLIGTRHKTAKLFQAIDWSSALVTQQTEALIHRQGLSLAYLPALPDIDNHTDFQQWRDSVIG